MRSTLNVLVSTIFLGLTAFTTEAAHTQARLLLSAETARAGETLIAGGHLKMEPAWHTYWKTSGASGIATSMKWELPPGITAVQIQWPTPKKLPPDALVT